MKKNMLLILTLAMLFAPAAQAQSAFAFQYTVGIPVGDLHDYIGRTSWRGVTFDYKYRFSNNISAGVSAGWNVFNERSSGTAEQGTLSVTGTQYRYTNSMPVFATADYFFSTEQLQPFVGLGVGTVWSARTTDAGLYRLDTHSWQFALAPEVGVAYFPSDTEGSMGVLLSARYNAAFKTDDLDSQSFLAINIGLIFKGL